MRSDALVPLMVLSVGLLLVGPAMQSLGQVPAPTYQRRVIRDNYKRDPGGSCVYNREGKVVFAPDGKNCSDATDHLSKSRLADSPIVASYPPAMRGELSKLLGDHDHIAQEIARLRQAVESSNRQVALEAVEKIRTEVTDHRAREEVFFEKMAPNPASLSERPGR